MKRQLIIGLALTASTITVSAPAQAWPYRNLEVWHTCLEEIVDTDVPYKDFSCGQIIATKDIIACRDAGGQIGAIGTRPVCINERVSKTRPKGGTPPFWSEAVAAKHFVPVTVPAELYNGQKDLRAGVGRPRPIEPIPLPRD